MSSSTQPKEDSIPSINQPLSPAKSNNAVKSPVRPSTTPTRKSLITPRTSVTTPISTTHVTKATAIGKRASPIITSPSTITRAKSAVSPSPSKRVETVIKPLSASNVDRKKIILPVQAPTKSKVDTNLVSRQKTIPLSSTSEKLKAKSNDLKSQKTSSLTVNQTSINRTATETQIQSELTELRKQAAAELENAQASMKSHHELEMTKLLQEYETLGLTSETVQDSSRQEQNTEPNQVESLNQLKQKQAQELESLHRDHTAKLLASESTLKEKQLIKSTVKPTNIHTTASTTTKKLHERPLSAVSSTSSKPTTSLSTQDKSRTAKPDPQLSKTQSRTVSNIKQISQKVSDTKKEELEKELTLVKANHQKDVKELQEQLLAQTKLVEHLKAQAVETNIKSSENENTISKEVNDQTQQQNIDVNQLKSTYRSSQSNVLTETSEKTPSDTKDEILRLQQAHSTELNNLQSQLETLDKLRTENETLKASIDTLTKQIFTLSTDKEELNAKMIEKDSKFTKEMSEMQRLQTNQQKQITKIQEQVESGKKELVHTKQLLQQATQNTKKSHKAESSNNTEQDLKQMLEEKNATIKELTAKLKEVSENLKITEKSQRGEYNAVLQLSTEKMKDLQKQHESTLTNRETQLLEQMKARESEWSTAKQELNGALTAAQVELNTLKYGTVADDQVVNLDEFQQLATNA